MQIKEALTILDRLSLQQSGRQLQSLELEIFTMAWENSPYKQIDTYQEQTVKNKALQLWRYLSQLLDTQVNKRNLRQVLEELNFGATAIQGLDRSFCQSIFTDHQLIGTAREWEILIQKYHGNPQYIKLIAPTIKDVFGGDIGKFLDANILLYDQIENIIADIFARLSSEELSIVIYLSIQIEPISLEQLIDNFSGRIESRQIVKLLDRLIRKYLIEAVNGTFALPDLILEYKHQHYWIKHPTSNRWRK